MKITHILIILFFTSVPIIIFSFVLKSNTTESHQANTIIVKSFYPIKEFTYKKMINEVKNKKLKRYQKNLISSASIKATFYLKPLNIPKPKNQKCRLTKQDFYWNLTIKYLLPQWRSRHLADPKLQKKWDKYLEKLINHEDKHKDIFLEAADNIYYYLNNIPPYYIGKGDNNCLEYVSKVKQKVFAIFKKYEEKNKIFDKWSNFGLKSGLLL